MIRNMRRFTKILRFLNHLIYLIITIIAVEQLKEPCKKYINNAKEYPDRDRYDQDEYRQPGRLRARRPSDFPELGDDLAEKAQSSRRSGQPSHSSTRCLISRQTPTFSPCDLLHVSTHAHYLASLPMLPVRPAARAVLLQFNTALSVPPILHRRVVTLFALITRKRDDLPCVASLGHRHTFLTGTQLPETPR